MEIPWADILSGGGGAGIILAIGEAMRRAKARKATRPANPNGNGNGNGSGRKLITRQDLVEFCQSQHAIQDARYDVLKIAIDDLKTGQAAMFEKIDGLVMHLLDQKK